MDRYLVGVEKAEGNYSACVPDLPGCVATEETREGIEHNMREAIRLHMEGLREDNLPIPRAEAFAEYLVRS
jgi:predicted RNase H-like HicB family nuclease